MSGAAQINDLLEVALGLTLDATRKDTTPSNRSTQAPPLVHLSSLAQELEAEQEACVLDADKVERALMSRLADAPSAREWPVQYLVGCHRRAMDLAQRVQSDGSLSDADKGTAGSALEMARQLSVSYAGFILQMQMFPQPELAERRGGGQLLDSYLMQVGVADGMGGSFESGAAGLVDEDVRRETVIEPIHPEFLPDYVARFSEDDGAQGVLEQIGSHLAAIMSRMTILADFGSPLTVLANVLSSSTVAAHMCKTSAFLPPITDEMIGRTIEDNTILGAAFGISAIPDVMESPVMRSPLARSPDVGDGLFPGDTVVGGRHGNTRAAHQSMHVSLDSLHSSLHRIVTNLLKNAEAKGRVLAWLAAALRVNKERTKMRPDLKKASTDGFMVNLACVLLRLCRPFLDPASGKAWARLDVRYISDSRSRGCAFEDDTRLGMADSDLQAWVQEAVLPHDPTSYHFICECFFMTANALRLGVFKAIEVMKDISRTARDWDREADLAGSPDDPTIGPRIRQMKRAAARYKTIASCMSGTLHGRVLLEDIIAYYSLLAAYFPRVALGGAAPSSGFSLPLPSPAPNEFLSLPEYFVENLCETLSWIGYLDVQLLSPAAVEQFMLFFALFLGSHDYVKNPYLRGKMVAALSSYIPRDDDMMDESNPWARSHLSSGSQEVTAMINAHPLVIQHLVKALVLLFVEIERTDRHNAFYEKFNTRYQIGEVMVYLWDHPGHREAWKRVVEDDPKLYVRFVNMMINDSQHLLQEALEALPEVRDIELRMADQDAWRAEPAATREELLQQLDRHRRSLRSDFELSTIYLKLMELTSSDPGICTRFFDVQIRDRQARILDFFLRYMTIPAERKRLKLKEPEKYGWKPRELLASLAQIHANIFEADREQWSAAVAADTDYYGTDPSILDHLIAILTSLNTNPAVLRSIQDLRAAAIEAVKNTAKEDENFEDSPEEFEDPLSCRLMKDPVKLPSGQVLDRATILQHLLTDNRDPFSRAPMTEDDLEEMPELRQRILAWMNAQRKHPRKSPGLLVPCASSASSARVPSPSGIPGPMYMSRDPLSDDQRSRFAKFGVVPNRSVSSLDLEEPRMVRVRLSVEYRVHSRQMLCVGGSAIPLGWSFLSIAKVPMSWEPQDRWVVEFELAAGSKLEYKYVILEEQDWTQQMNAATEGMVEYEYRVQPEVNPPDVQRITRRMAIVAWQSGGNRVLVMPSEEEIEQVTGNGGGWRAFEGKVGGAGATWTVGADGAGRDASSSLSREHLHIDETTGLPVLDRLDAWGDDGISPYR